jgi:hypothetical protein
MTGTAPRDVLHSLVTLLVFGVSLAPGQDQDTVRAPLSNLEVYQRIARIAGDSLADAVRPEDSASIGIEVQPENVRWFLEQPLYSSFRDKGWSVRIPDSSVYHLDVGIYDLHIEYANPRRRSFLGTRILDRKGVLALHYRLSSRIEGQILLDGKRTWDYADVVEVSSVPRLEFPDVPSTHAEVPREGFFSDFAEPLIMLGSIAVAVFLLFTVRS